MMDFGQSGRDRPRRLEGGRRHLALAVAVIVLGPSDFPMIVFGGARVRSSRCGARQVSTAAGVVPPASAGDARCPRGLADGDAARVGLSEPPTIVGPSSRPRFWRWHGRHPLEILLSQVLDESQSLAGLLRKCLALGAETGSTPATVGTQRTERIQRGD